MAYIPERHKKYGLLPLCTEQGGEVFAYGSTCKLEKLLNRFFTLNGTLDPYGYDSYDDYFKKLDDTVALFAAWPEAIKAIEQYKAQLIDYNQKEYWSVCRYLGGDIINCPGLTHGKVYYWPCSATDPKYIGVIDDEEFTNYLYPFNPELWEILDDPTGMVKRLFNWIIEDRLARNMT